MLDRNSKILIIGDGGVPLWPQNSEAASVSLAPSLAAQGIALLRGPFLGWGFPIEGIAELRLRKREFLIGLLDSNEKENSLIAGIFPIGKALVVQLKAVGFASRCACGFAAILGILWLGSPALAGISMVDAGTEWTTNNMTNSSLTNTENFSISAGADVLVVEMGWRQGGGNSVPSVTYNGQPLNEVVYEPSASNCQVSSIFCLTSTSAGWATGASDPLSVTFGTNTSEACIDAFTLSGVDLTKLPGSGLANSTAVWENDGSPTMASVTLSNVAAGSWVAFATSYRANNASYPPLTAWTSVPNVGTLAGGQSSSANGNLWCASTNNSSQGSYTIEAGGILSNVQSPTFTLSESNAGGAADVHWTMAAAVFQPYISTLTWTGTAGSGGTAAWNTTSANWSGASNYYSDLDAVVFPEGAANANITISSSVAPSSITFNNATTVYSFSGGAITGATGMTLNGGGLVVLSNSNTFLGVTTINAGTLQLGDGVNNNGSVAGNIADNAALVFANVGAQTYGGQITGGGAGGVTSRAPVC